VTGSPAGLVRVQGPPGHESTAGPSVLEDEFVLVEAKPVRLNPVT
jgi:hypothetical protein